MFIKNKTFRLIAFSALTAALVSSTSVTAETAGGTASILVQNSFTLVQTTPINFGTVVAIADDDAVANVTDVGTLILSSDGVAADTITNAGNASIIAIVAGTAATFTVSGASPNTTLTVTLPGAFNLIDGSATDNKVFIVNAFTTTVTQNGPNDNFSYVTDAGGNLVFNMGATLITDNVQTGSGASAAEPYRDGVTYAGTYTMTVAY